MRGEPWIVMLGAALCACSLTALDGFSGGGSSGGSVPPPAQVDASSEGGPASGGPSECEKSSSAHLLCDDFDRGPLPGPWSGTQVTLGAMSLDRTVSRSGAGSLSVVLSPAMDTTRPQAFIASTFTIRPKTLSLAFDVRFDTIDDPASSTPIVIGSMLVSQGAKYGVHLVLVGTSLGLWEQILSATGQGGTSAKHPLPGEVTLGMWNRYRIELLLDSSSGLASVWRDDAQVVNVVIKPTVLDGTPLVGIGVSASGTPSPGVSAHFDNAIIDAK